LRHPAQFRNRKGGPSSRAPSLVRPNIRRGGGKTLVGNDGPGSKRRLGEGGLKKRRRKAQRVNHISKSRKDRKQTPHAIRWNLTGRKGKVSLRRGAPVKRDDKHFVCHGWEPFNRRSIKRRGPRGEGSQLSFKPFSQQTN